MTLDREALDRYITGNGGEDQFVVHSIGREPHSYLEAPDDSGCFMCGATEHHSPILDPVMPMADARLDVGAGNRRGDAKHPMYALLDANGATTTSFGEYKRERGRYYPLVAYWEAVEGSPFATIIFSWESDTMPVKTISIELGTWWTPDGRDLYFPVPMWEELI